MEIRVWHFHPPTYFFLDSHERMCGTLLPKPDTWSGEKEHFFALRRVIIGDGVKCPI
ncbi:MAG: hypothetical protein ISS59_05385 [Desulfobacteraceae bacterium]|nr:hypothetical protein [Desulfobacteraceae bacterium]